MLKIIGIVVWFIVFMTLLTCALNLISLPSTLFNIVGVLLLLGTIIISSKCYKLIIKK